jgi:hypothetical protein
MSEPTNLADYAAEDFARKATLERAATAKALRILADRIEGLRDGQLVEVLPIAAWGVAELEQRLAPWLPKHRIDFLPSR